MGLLSKLLGRCKPHGSDESQPPREACVCKECGKGIPSVRKEMVDNGTIYCKECTTAQEPIKEYFTRSNEFEVFVYAIPWNPAIRAYAYHGQGWLPTYQADTSGFNLHRHVSRNQIPGDAMLASITLAISEHGSFTYYRNKPAFIAMQEVGLLCAYVPEDKVYR